MDEMSTSTVDGTEVVSTIDTVGAQLCLCRDGVIEVRIRDGATLGLYEMKKLLTAQLTLSKEEPAVVFVDARLIRSMTREAQEFTANTANNRNTRAVAILVGSAVSALLGNFFIELAHPMYPTKVFRDPAKARVWVLSQLEASLGR